MPPGTYEAATPNSSTSWNPPSAVDPELDDDAKLAQKILAAKAQIRPARQDSQNTFTNSSYASISAVLEAVEPALASVGILAYSCIENEGSLLCITTVLMDTATGARLCSSFPLATTDPQKVAAATTYARRVNLVALLNLRSADDDGNAAAEQGAYPSASAPAGGPAPWMPPAASQQWAPPSSPAPDLF